MARASAVRARETRHLSFRPTSPTRYESVYAVSKAGLIGLTRSLRVEYRSAPVGFSADAIHHDLPRACARTEQARIAARH